MVQSVRELPERLHGWMTVRRDRPEPEQGESVVERQVVDIRKALLFLEGMGHSGEFHFMETVNGLL